MSKNTNKTAAAAASFTTEGTGKELAGTFTINGKAIGIQDISLLAALGILEKVTTRESESGKGRATSVYRAGHITTLELTFAEFDAAAARAEKEEQDREKIKAELAALDAAKKEREKKENERRQQFLEKLGKLDGAPQPASEDASEPETAETAE